MFHSCLLFTVGTNLSNWFLQFPLNLTLMSPIFVFTFSFRNLLALHRMATLHHDELGQVSLISWSLLTCCYHVMFWSWQLIWLYVFCSQLQETLLNLLLRNYLHYNLYDQAEKLRSKAPRFEAHSNQQVIHLLIPFIVIQSFDLLYVLDLACVRTVCKL